MRKVCNNLQHAFIILIIGIGCLGACKQEDVKQEKKSEPVKDEHLVQLNRDLVMQEQEEIASYIKRYGYKMKMTETGLHFMHIKEGSGNKAEMESGVSVKYTLHFIDGSYVYSSDSSGVLNFRLGKSDEPAGLQEGLLRMKEGGKALIIVPSYLAYGLTGDANKIGPARTLIYNVELLKVEP